MKTADLAQIVTFRLGDDMFAADIYSVERVLRYQPATPVPNVPEWISGVIDYQGKVVPVIDLRRRFQLPPLEAASETRILVFNAGGDFIAATVDGVMEVSQLNAAQVAPPPPLFRGLAGEYLRGIVRRADKLVIFLDVARLLTTDERLTLERASAGSSGGGVGREDSARDGGAEPAPVAEETANAGEASDADSHPVVTAEQAVLPAPDRRRGAVRGG